MGKGLFSIFKRGLNKSANDISTKLSKVDSVETLEELLISLDFGISTTFGIIDNIKKDIKKGNDKSKLIELVKKEVLLILENNKKSLSFSDDKLNLILMVGVNGSGKTTTTGKLAASLKEDGKKVILGACDTFRAAAVDQLKLWGEKLDIPVVLAKHGADPAAVAFDAVTSANAKKSDFLILDTAGRQHNNKNLMDELQKIKRSATKATKNISIQTWLVLDGTVGGNALAQAKEFMKIVDVDGFICTKLDGTSKGGMVVAVSDEVNIPIYYLGLGEQVGDLQPFEPSMFVDALFGE